MSKKSLPFYRKETAEHVAALITEEGGKVCVKRFNGRWHVIEEGA